MSLNAKKEIIKTFYKYKKYDSDFPQRLGKDFEGSIWMSNSISLNDPHDLHPSLELEFNEDIYKFLINEIHNHQGDLLDCDFCRRELNFMDWVRLSSKEYGHKAIAGVIKNFQYSNRKQWVEKFIAEYKKLFAKVMKRTHIFCMTTGWNKKQMWAYYGDSYKGYCISYTYKPDYRNEYFCVRRCQYVKNIGHMPDKLFYKHDFTNYFIKKHIDFRSEDERRLIFTARKNTGKGKLLTKEEKNSHPLAIKEVYIGYQMDHKTVERFIIMSKLYKVPLLVVTPCKTSLQLKREKIYVPEHLENDYVNLPQFGAQVG